MSLIHDALRKLEREKKGPLPPGTEHLVPPLPEKIKGRKFPFFWGLLGLGVGLIAVGLSTQFKSSPELKVASTLPEVPEEVLLPPAPVLSPEPAPAPIPETIPLSLPSRTESTFTLSGVVQGEGEPFAVINNQITRVGDEVEGARLIAIGTNQVTLLRDGEEILLRLK